MSWHTQSIHSVESNFSSNLKTGLEQSEVKAAQLKYGLNSLPDAPGKSILTMILGQLSDFMIIILLVAALISILLGEVHDSLVIIFIVVINAIIGVVQEFRAEKSLQELKKIVTPTAFVIRSGVHLEIPNKELVPGDIVILEAGYQVPADLRLIESHSLRIDEATLTGESVPVEKSTLVQDNPDLMIGDQHNMAFSATSVTYGRGKAIVVATGSHTEFGKIAHLLIKEQRVKTPLQVRLARFGKKLTIFLIFLCLSVFLLGLLRGGEPFLMFLTAVSLAVAAIPEALPSVVTVSLALGAKVLAKKKALVQSLPAVEALGSITFICSDKTGTITKNEMKAEVFFIEDKNNATAYWRALSLNNDSKYKDGHFIGDPTEVGIIRGAMENGMDPKALQLEYPRIFELPFDSKRKLMSTIHKNNEVLFITKGAPEVLLPLCGKEELLKEVEEMAKQGLRVLAFAHKPFLENEIPLNEDASEEQVAQLETGLDFLGLVGLLDPPREEIPEAVQDAKNAGITPIMITGDHPITAMVIAKRVGIIDSDKQLVLTGSELKKLSDEELSKNIRRVRVFSRCSPEQKIRIVKTLQKLGEHVSMTGDGVNDAPSLKRADVGIAMGITGTHVAKEAAEITLLDDNFATIVNAIREGRRILINIKKFIKFALTGNTGEIITILCAPLFGLPIPLLPIHILWVNLVTDGLPGLALANEVEEEDIMKVPPRNPSEGLITKKTGIHIIFYGIIIASCTLYAAYLGLKQSIPAMHTMAFTVLSFSQLLLVMELRFNRVSAFNFKLMSKNLPIHIAFYLSAGIIPFALYTKWGQFFFKTIELSQDQLLSCFCISFIVIVVKEIEKLIFKIQGLK